MQNSVEFRGKKLHGIPKEIAESLHLGDIGTRKHGERNWRHGDLETWTHEHMDMNTWTHGHMDTWTHGHMETRN
jgi:hypothetical protein